MKKVLYLFLLIAGLSSVANFAYSDTSGIITIYNPNAGVQWYAGTSYNITWYYDHTYNVKIELLGPGATVTTLIGSTPNSSWNWPIPSGQTPGTYQIRITSVYNPATTTTSSAFTIAAYDPNKIITIYRPVVGEQWIRGTSYPITWWDNLTEGVDVHLYASDKTTLVGTIATNQSGPTASWIVGDFAGGNPVPAGNYYIKLTSNTNSSILVWSGMFSVIDNDPNLNITVYNPYVGEEWVKGSSKNITWWDNITGNVDIQLYQSDKTTLVGTIASNQSGATKSWTVGDLGGPAVPEGFYYIKIVGHTVSGVAGWSGLFHIITTDPNSIITIYRPVVGEEWIRGTNYPITWWDNITEGVDIHLYKSDNTYVGTIATNQAGPTYPWIIGDHLGANPIPAGDYYIKLTSNINSGIFVKSGIFHIVTTNPNSIITLYRPVVGEEWVRGTSYPITWWDNITEGVDIHLYKSDHTTLVGTIATGQTGTTFSWTIGNYLGSNPVPTGDYYIKICSSLNSSIVVWSGLFKIIKADQNMMFTLYNPYSGEEWVEGTTHNITWWDNFSENVKIELFTDAGVFVRPIVASTPSNGTYAWTIPWHPDLLPFTVPGNYKLNFSRLTTNAMQTGADRLVQTQHVDGGWGWPLDLSGPTALNILGPTAKGLIQAYGRNLSATQLTAINKAKTLLLSKVGTFSPSDGYLAKAIDDVLGGTTCVSYLNANYYGPLAAGTYVKVGEGAGGSPYNTASYLTFIHNRRAGGQENMAAWDMGMGLVGAYSCGVTGSELTLWTNATKAEINAMTAGNDYDVIGLAGSLYGLAFIGATFDPTSGSYASASSLSDLANILATYQINNGGFSWRADMVVPNDYNETMQETAYAILALNAVNRTGFLDKILGAADYIASVQLPNGGWEDWGGPASSGEYNEMTGEALWGYTVAYQPGTYPSVSMWGDPFKIVLDGKKSGSGVNGDATSQILNIYPNPANDKVNISTDNTINHVWVLNNMGKIVIENSPNANQASIDVSMLSPGLYIIKAETNGTVTTNKVMIK
jgi:hypothetical protein